MHLSVREMVLFSFFTALIAAGAFIRIPLAVCPFTLQLLFTTLAGLLLGGKRGALAVGVYILLGLIGLPVFTSGGGPAYVLQPTFGYLPGFAAGAWLTGYLVRRTAAPSFRRLCTAAFAGLALVYFCGIVYLALINALYLGTPLALSTLIFYCIVLALPGDIFLCLLAAFLARRLLRVISFS